MGVLRYSTPLRVARRLERSISDRLARSGRIRPVARPTRSRSSSEPSSRSIQMASEMGWCWSEAAGSGVTWVAGRPGAGWRKSIWPRSLRRRRGRGSLLDAQRRGVERVGDVRQAAGPEGGEPVEQAAATWRGHQVQRWGAGELGLAVGGLDQARIVRQQGQGEVQID